MQLLVHYQQPPSRCLSTITRFYAATPPSSPTMQLLRHHNQHHQHPHYHHHLLLRSCDSITIITCSHQLCHSHHQLCPPNTSLSVAAPPRTLTNGTTDITTLHAAAPPSLPTICSYSSTFFHQLLLHYHQLHVAAPHLHQLFMQRCFHHHLAACSCITTPKQLHRHSK